MSIVLMILTADDEVDEALAKATAALAASGTRDSSGDPARKYLGVTGRLSVKENPPLSADEPDDQPF